MQQPIVQLLALVERCLPFTSSDGQSFVRIPVPVSGGFSICPVRSAAFRRWFYHEFYCLHAVPPPPRAFHTLLLHLEAEAHHYDERNTSLGVFRRVACDGTRFSLDQILLDLADPQRHFVDISRDGWKTTAGPGVLLQTSRSTDSLPAPEIPAQPSAPAPLEILRSILNFPTRAAWLRCLAWLLAAFRPIGPFPVLILQGPPGSGKSFAARVLRSLIDPSSAPFTPVPSSVRDLITLAHHNWVLAFDHISTLSPQLTDALCRLSSGLGVSLRETSGPDSEPLLQNLRRPVILTVTDRWSCPPDLAGRAFTVTLPPIPLDTCRTEFALRTTLEQAQPAILGALCSAVSTALGRFPQTNLLTGGSANVLAWAMAASPALGCTEDEMLRALAPAPPPHPMAEAVRALLEQRRSWTGTATDLLDLLKPLVSCQTPKGVSQQLKTCMLTLADQGIELKFRHLHGNRRIIDLREEDGGASFPQNAKDAPPDFNAPPQPTETEEVPAP